MNLIHMSFFIFIFMKQFYMFSSGGLQFGDLFFILSFILYFHSTKNKGKFKIESLDNYLLIFVYLVLIINLIYFTIYDKYEFMASSFHYIYNFMVVILFRSLIRDNKFIEGLLKILKLNLIVQFFIYAIGIGRYYLNIRYMGTFNDPNQLAFFIYITIMLIVLISDILDKGISIIYYGITWILIFESSSAGMLLGISIFTVLIMVLKFTNNIINIHNTRSTEYKSIRIKPKKIMRFILIILIYIMIIYPNTEKIKESLSDSFIFNRVEEKIDKLLVNEEENTSLVEDRGIDKLFLYPEQMLLGAGQGYFGRFIGTHTQGEIHSTLPSILFCYGIIPMILVIIWIFNNIRSIPVHIYAIYISLLIESFTLLNQRQPFFWMLFVLGSVYTTKYNTDYKRGMTS